MVGGLLGGVGHSEERCTDACAQSCMYIQLYTGGRVNGVLLESREYCSAELSFQGREVPVPAAFSESKRPV